MKTYLLPLMALIFFWGTNVLSAQEYCLSEAFGYGQNATGGTGGSVVTVSTVSELEDACALSGKYIILVKGTLDFTSRLTISPVDKTIIGLPGSVLSNAGRTQSTSGILVISDGANNVILRNLTFKSAGAYDCDGFDNLGIDDGTDIWVDHCDFQDGVDGNFDNKHDADNITVSWCRFRYLIEPLAGGSGGSDDHRNCCLLGSHADDAPQDGTFNFTWAYNWWDGGCAERMVRCRNARLDYISNYWNSADALYYMGPQNASIYAEGCYFEGLSEYYIFYENYGGTNYCKFVDSYGSVDGVPPDQGNVTAPSYSYTAYSYENTKTFVTGTCGAGATLLVDETTGEVSAECSSVLPTLALVSEAGSNEQTVDVGAAISAIQYVFGGTATAVVVSGLPDGISYSTEDSLVTISGSISENASTQSYSYTISTDPEGASMNGTITVLDPSGIVTPGAEVYLSQQQDRISLQGAEAKTMSLYRLDGLRLKTTTAQYIALSDLKSGLFIVVAQTADGTLLTKKILKRD